MKTIVLLIVALVDVVLVGGSSAQGKELIYLLGFVYDFCRFGSPRFLRPQPETALCYFGSWSFYRPGDGKPKLAGIGPLCTHIIYAFAKLEGNAITVFDQGADLRAARWLRPDA